MTTSLYRDQVAQACEANGGDFCSYCLMPNHVHVHLATVPDTQEDSSARASG